MCCISTVGGNTDAAYLDQMRRHFGIGATPLVAGDFALSAGWGLAPTIQVVSGTDGRGTITVRASGGGFLSNPTITLTFSDGAWSQQPFALVDKIGGNGPSAFVLISSLTTTTFVWLYAATPIEGLNYQFSWQIQ
jgi:hypothetical protein